MIKKYGNEMTLLLLIIILVLIFSIFSSNFFKLGNITQISAQMVELSLLTLGMSVCIISGGFDLSIGAMTGLGSVSLAMLLKTGMNMWSSILLVLLLLLICGLLNGSLIGFLRINPMLVTLGTSSLYTGLALVFSRGTAISNLPEQFSMFGQYYVWIIPYQALILLIGLITSVILLNFTIWGRRVYLIGSNPDVARFAGINCGYNLMLVYVYSAVLAFLAALVLTSRVATGRADLGDTYVLQSVSAAVFGGVGISGGSGTVLGAVLGVTIFAIISNGFNMLDFSPYAQQIVIGCTLIAVLAYRMWLSTK